MGGTVSGLGRGGRATAVGGVRHVTVTWVSQASGVSLDGRQAQLLRLLLQACARRFRLARAPAATGPNGGGGTATPGNILRWTLQVRANGTVQRTHRIQTPPALTDPSGLRCVDYVVGRAVFTKRIGTSPFRVTLSAALNP